MAYNSKYTGAQVDALLDRAGEAPQTYDIGWLFTKFDENSDSDTLEITSAQFEEAKAACQAGKVFVANGNTLMSEYKDNSINANNVYEYVVIPFVDIYSNYRVISLMHRNVTGGEEHYGAYNGTDALIFTSELVTINGKDLYSYSSKKDLTVKEPYDLDTIIDAALQLGVGDTLDVTSYLSYANYMILKEKINNKQVSIDRVYSASVIDPSSSNGYIQLKCLTTDNSSNATLFNIVISPTSSSSVSVSLVLKKSLNATPWVTQIVKRTDIEGVQGNTDLALPFDLSGLDDNNIITYLIGDNETLITGEYSIQFEISTADDIYVMGTPLNRILMFDTGGTAPTISWPSVWIWPNGDPVSLEPYTHYEFNILGVNLSVGELTPGYTRFTITWQAFPLEGYN